MATRTTVKRKEKKTHPWHLFFEVSLQKWRVASAAVGNFARKSLSTQNFQTMQLANIAQQEKI